jgi:4-hydroxy-tetrahydrodipicolinate synthase
MSYCKFVPVMISPFNLKAELDYDAINVLIDFYLAAGVKGFFANCLSSEMFSISESERIALTKHVVQYVNHRVPVVATSSFGLTLNDKAIFTKKIFDTGIDAAILITGHMAKVEDSDEVLLKNFDQIFNLTNNIPLGMYECPAPYKRILNAETFEKIIQNPRMVYHKDTSISHQNVKAKLDVLSTTKTNLEFYDAHTPNATFSIQNGAKGMSSISGNFYPEIMVWMVNNANNINKQNEVEWLQNELNKVDALIHVNYPLSAKYFLAKRGLPIRSISRATAIQLTPEQKSILDDIYIKFENWCSILEIEKVNVTEIIS